MNDITRDTLHVEIQQMFYEAGDDEAELKRLTLQLDREFNTHTPNDSSSCNVRAAVLTIAEAYSLCGDLLIRKRRS